MSAIERRRFLINFFAFNLLWAGLVFAAVKSLDLYAALLVLLWLPFHLKLSPAPWFELKLVLGCTLLGPMTDLMFMQLGLLSYHGTFITDGLPPVWIFGLWALFATTLLHSMKWLQRNSLLALLFGGIGGAMAYFAGCRIGAADMLKPAPLVFGVIGVTWAIAMPLMAWIARHAPQNAELPVDASDPTAPPSAQPPGVQP